MSERFVDEYDDLRNAIHAKGYRILLGDFLLNGEHTSIRLEPGTEIADRLAEATWYRCRSLKERKDRTAWMDLPAETRDVWCEGARADLQAAGSFFARRSSSD